MIKVMDLITWARMNAVEVSLRHPTGWIRGDALEQLAAAVRKSEPFDYAPTYQQRPKQDTGGSAGI